jgi:hypothetical protein
MHISIQFKEVSPSGDPEQANDPELVAAVYENQERDFIEPIADATHQVISKGSKKNEDKH